MSSMRLLFGLVLAIALYPSVSFAEWTLVANENNGTRAYILTESITRIDANNTQAWTKYDVRYSTDPQDKNLLEIVILRQFNCRLRISRYLQYTEYFKDGKVQTDSMISSWKYVIPESIGEALLDIACQATNFRRPT